MQTKAGSTSNAKASISGVAPISMFNGTGSIWRNARTSSRWTWRPSDRGCTVIESAPPATASAAAASRSGSRLGEPGSRA